MSSSSNQKKLIAHIKTYGCQQNVADGEKIRGVLNKIGYRFSDNKNVADLIIFNTCAIREHAEDRVFGNVGTLKSLKMKKRKLIIVLCGCMMEQRHIVEKVKKMFPFVDIILGTSSIHKLPDFINKVRETGERIFDYNNGDDVIVEGLPIKREEPRIKALLSVMYGCDNFCSYCIVPYVRGRERSRRSSNIIEETKEIVKLGYKEITLLGQNVNSYGKGLDEKINFPKLLEGVSRVEGDFWVRFMTSHPKDVTKELIDVIARSEKVCKHLHLPVQSGSNKILKKMNRNYTREHYLEIVNYAREKIPNISLTTDIIVGFPGETYEDFLDTISIVRRVEFTSLFTFIYSKREGTLAAEMEDLISYETKTEWLSELICVQREMSDKYCDSMVGKVERVLIEKQASANRGMNARTQGSAVIEVTGNNSLVGQFANVKITGRKNWTLKGQVI